MYAVRHAELLPILDRTLGQLIDAGLKCKPRKCQMFPDSIQYMGHISNDGKIAAQSSKVDNREYASWKLLLVKKTCLGLHVFSYKYR